MNDIIKSFVTIPRLLFRHPKLLFWGALPILLTMVIYFFIGAWWFGTVRELGVQWIEAHVGTVVGSEIGLKIMMAFLLVIMGLLFYFLLNFFFLILMGFVGGPFFDLLSEKTEISLGWNLSLEKRVLKGFGYWKWMIRCEFKKMMIVLSLSILSFFLGLVPIFIPFSFMFLSLLISIEFTSYNWWRHQLLWSEVMRDLRRHFFIYLISGAIFFLLLAIPIVNLLTMPVAIIYYSVLWCHRYQQAD